MIPFLLLHRKTSKMNAFLAALCVAAVGATNLRANVSTASLTARIKSNISQNAAANAVCGDFCQAARDARLHLPLANL